MHYTLRQTPLIITMIAAIAMIIFFPKPVQAAVNCSNPGIICKNGSISSNETWTNQNVYVIQSSLTIPLGTTLTIEAGTIIKFNIGARLVIQGELIVNGTEDNPVYFTSIRDDTLGGDTDNETVIPQPGNWQHLQFQSGSNGTLRNMEVRYGGGYSTAMLQLDVNATVSIQNSFFKHGYQCALSTHPQNDFSLEDMDVSHFTGNVYNGICINGGDITTDTTWDETEAVYIITNDVRVAFSKNLTIGAGVTIKFADRFLGSNLLIYGSLQAQGTADQRIYITSTYDDTIGGATDNTTTPPSPGSWGQLRFHNGSSGTLTYVEVRYGGGTSDNAMLWKEVDADIIINNSFFVNSQRCPLAMPPQGDITLMNMSPAHFSGNEFNGICIKSGGISANTTWDETEAPYVLEGDVTVATGVTLTWGPGIVMKPRDTTTDVVIDGTLNANGTASQPITLTSVRDDTIGGATDNTTNPPAAGDWGRILFRSTGRGQLRHIELRYGGQGWSMASMLEQDIGAEVTIDAGTFKYSSGCALTTHPQTDITLMNMTVTNLTGNHTNGICVKSGGISANTTWDETEAPYVLQGDVTVATGVTLTWGPGIVVKPRDTTTDVVIDGTLNANGTASQPITLTSVRDDTIGGATDNTTNPPAAGDWGRILFRSTGRGQLRHIELRYGGQGWSMASMLEQDIGAEVTIDAGTFKYSSGCALTTHPQTDITLMNMTVTNLTGNHTNGICVKSGGISANTTWDETEAPYVLQGDVTVATGVTLTWGPGIVVKPRDTTTDVLVDGILNVNGTESQPVYITSIYDSLVGGSTISSTTSPGHGQWGSITFRNNSRGVLAYIIVRYGGSPYSNNAAIWVDNASPILRFCTLTRNTYGLRSSGNLANPLIENCNITENASFGIYNDTPNHWITATRNWWGNVTGPLDSSSSDGEFNNGSGDKVSNFVAYRPWLQTRVVIGTTQHRVFIPQIVR
ncbi:hypothetical protein [Chloroflexus sp.]|uniref:hypothetical protein n=1 Tax=Chloroflexus sp. TaxID=1904827 RepID=UPI00257D0E2A|nr:hypothetical protein [Chloroflexus sp.]